MDRLCDLFGGPPSTQLCRVGCLYLWDGCTKFGQASFVQSTLQDSPVKCEITVITVTCKRLFLLLQGHCIRYVILIGIMNSISSVLIAYGM